MPPENQLTDFFDSQYYTPIENTLVEEELTEEEKLEEERLRKQKEQQLEEERLNSLQVQESSITTESAPELVDFFESKYFQESPVLQEQPNTELDESVSFARKVNYGMAQEPTAIGSAYRLIKAGVQAGLDSSEDYKQARERIENKRQEEIFEEFPEFKGKHEDAGVLVGRGSMALIDPITFLIPWTKIAKAGKIASISSGAGVAAVDLSLREEALYGKVSPETVLLGLGLGAAGATVGEVVMAYAKRGVNETVEVVTETGKKINKKVEIPKGADAPKLTPKEIAAVEKAEAATIKASEEAIESQGILYARIQEIKVLREGIKEQIEKINSKKPLTAAEIDTASKAKKTFKTSPTVRLNKQLKKLEVEQLNLDKEIARITNDQVSENILDILSNGMVAGFKENVLTEGMARALVQEAVRPLFGGIIGAGIGAQFTDETDTNATMAQMATIGFFAGAFQRKIQTTPYQLKLKGIPEAVVKAAGDEVELIYRKSIWLHLKSITAGSHVQDLMAYSAPVVNYAARMFKMQGGGVALGKSTKGLSVEEEALRQAATWRAELIDMVSETNTDVMILAGKIVNERGLNKNVKVRFLKPEDIADKKLYAEAKILATKIDDYTLRFKQYAKSTGLDFTDEARYGLTQMLDDKALGKLTQGKTIAKLAEAFQLQSKNEAAKKLRKSALTYDEALIVAENYFVTSKTPRTNSIWQKEGEGWMKANEVAGDVSKLPKGKRAGDEDFILTAARHFNKERTLYDQEARALVSDLFEQNPLLTLKQLTENTVPVAEFARVFGARGEGIKTLFRDIDDVMLQRANKDVKNKFANSDELYRSQPAIKQIASREKQKIKDSLEAYFKVYGAAAMPVSEAGKATAVLLQSVLATTRLTKVAIPSMGDWMQTITNSGFGPATKSALNQIKKTGKGAEVLALKGGVKQIDGKDVTFMDKFLGNNRYDNIIERELQDVFLIGSGPSALIQRRATAFTRKFFEVVQLGRITRIARGFAFDAGTHRVMDISRKLGKGKKVSNALQKEIDTLGLNVDNIMYLSKFKNVDDAFADATGKQYLTKAGIKSADRDAIIPTVGNRRLFSQTKNPYVKFLGSFMSWAQAKTSQTNALLARIEQGDAALAMRIAAALPLYYSIMSAQIALSSNQEYKEERQEMDWWKKVGETLSFAGWNTAWVDKAVNIKKFAGYGTNVPEQLAPVLGMMDDFLQIPLTIGDENRSTVEQAAKLVPFGKDIYSGAEKLMTPKSENVISFSMGGIVGEELIQGPEVPFTQDNAADRINPITGLPYNQPAITYK